MKENFQLTKSIKTMKKFYLIASLCVAMCIVFISCSEDMGYGDCKENAKNEMLFLAKDIVNKQDGVVPLPVNNNGGTESRSGMSLITNGTPLWDIVKYYNIDGMQVLMVDLQTAEQVYSRITSTKDGVTSTKESETFSRLVVRRKGAQILTHIITYMPDAEYAQANKERLKSMGYYPKDVNFTGITLTSYLDGSVFRGVRYDNGKVASIISKPQHTECNHDHGDCSHAQHDEYTKPININLYTESSQEPMSREIIGIVCQCGKLITNGKCQDCGWGFADECPSCKLATLVNNICLNCGNIENIICPDCRKEIKDCKCGDICPFCGNIKCTCDELCESCRRPKKHCTCDKGEYEDCPWCGVKYEGTTHSCEKSGCDVCKQLNCICNIPPTEPCKNCKQTQCICERNTTPILYTPHSGDYMVLSNMEGCVMNNTCSVFAALETACIVHGSTATQGDMYALYAEINNVTPEDPLHLDINCDFLVDYFMYTVTNDIKRVVRYGVPVVVWYNNKYVTVVGIQYDGDIIYADHENGNLYAVEENYFNGCESIVIESVFL